MGFSTPVSTRFGSVFTENVKKRGVTYKNTGRVSITKRGSSSVRARIRGTEVYQVEVTIRPDGLFMSCTCPYYEDELEPCKHIWATILKAESIGELDADCESIPRRVIMSSHALEYGDRGWEWRSNTQIRRRGRPPASSAGTPKAEPEAWEFTWNAPQKMRGRPRKESRVKPKASPPRPPSTPEWKRQVAQLASEVRRVPAPARGGRPLHP